MLFDQIKRLLDVGLESCQLEGKAIWGMSRLSITTLWRWPLPPALNLPLSLFGSPSPPALSVCPALLWVLNALIISTQPGPPPITYFNDTVCVLVSSSLVVKRWWANATLSQDYLCNPLQLKTPHTVCISLQSVLIMLTKHLILTLQAATTKNCTHCVYV